MMDSTATSEEEKQMNPVIQRLFGGSKIFITLAVAGTLISAFALLVYGLLASVDVAIDTIVNGDISVGGAKHLAVDFIELTDLFILGTVLYVVALGLYKLFIDEHLPTPNWLEIGTLDELKERLISGIVVLMAVSFLGDLVTWESGRDILFLGIGTAVTTVGLATYLYLAHRKRGHGTSR